VSTILSDSLPSASPSFRIREWGREGIEEFTEVKAIGIAVAA
jgi:hypothetical protein